MIDTTLRGDLSELLLGGDKGAAGVCVTVCVRAAHGFLEDLVLICMLSPTGKQAVRAVGHLRSTSKLLMQAAAVHAAKEGDASGQMSGLVGKLFKGTSGKKGPATLDLEDLLIHVNDFNPAIPDNLYLCPGGTGPQASYPVHQRMAIAATLRHCLEQSQHSWKLMCDTDGDQGFSDYTKIAHGTCDSCVIPLKTNVNDFSNRCVPMMEELFVMRQSGEARSRIQLIVWNEVDVYKNSASPVSGLITPPKAAQGIISMLNSLVSEVAATYPDLFHNTPPPDPTDNEAFTGDLFLPSSS